MSCNIFRSILGVAALSTLGIANAAVVTLPTTPTGPSLSIGDTGLVPITYQPGGGSFTDNFYFSLASTSQLSSNVTNVAFSWVRIFLFVNRGID